MTWIIQGQILFLFYMQLSQQKGGGTAVSKVVSLILFLGMAMGIVMNTLNSVRRSAAHMPSWGYMVKVKETEKF